MAFERFTKVGSIFKTKASISLTGVISFSEGARIQFGLSADKDSYAALFYDKENRVVGIKFLSMDDGNGVVKVRYRTTGLDLSAKAFLDYYNIQPTVTSLYEVEKNEMESLVIIRLETAKLRKKREVRTTLFSSQNQGV